PCRLAVTPEVPQARGRVIRDLREKAAEVDAVRGGQPMLLSECRIDERRFDHRLTVVEAAVDLERLHVAAPARELMLLPRRYLPLREQHADAHALPAVERGRNGPAGIARRRDEDRERPAGVAAR